MKFRSLLIISTILVPSLVNAQSVDTDKAVVLTNSGKMYIGKASTSDVTMSVEGSVLFVAPDNVAAADKDKGDVKMAANSKMSLTGDILADVDATKKTVVGFDVSGGTANGTVLFLDRATAKDAKDVPFYTFTGTGKISDLKYGGTSTTILKRQHDIKSYVNASKAFGEKPRIVLPNMEVATASYVSLDYLTQLQVGDMAASSAKGDIVVQPGGLFSVGAKYVSAASELASQETAKPYDQQAERMMLVGNLFFNEFDLKQGALTNAATAYGGVLFDLELFDKTKAESSGFGGNFIGTTTEPTDGKIRPLYGFASPYKTLGTDHMIYNTLTMPRNAMIGGDWEGPVTDHKAFINPGIGYFIAQEVSDFDYAEILYRTNANKDLRAHGGYQFNREYFLSNRDKFNQNADRSAAVYKDEVFVSPKKEVVVNLKEGKNFIANPYLLPINVSDIIGATTEATLTNWKASSGTAVTAGPTKLSTLRNKIWIPYDGSINSETDPWSRVYYRYHMKYTDSQKNGGTTEGGVTKSNVIAPLQVFVVQASKDCQIAIPRNFVVTKNVQSTPTQRSGFVSIDDLEDDNRIDEVLLQTEVLATDDAGESYTKSMDRVSIVLRDNASLSAGDNIDTPKELMNRSVNALGEADSRSASLRSETAQPFGGVLYTQTPEGTPLMTTAIPSSTKQIPIYFTPTDEESTVRFTTKRMETLTAGRRAWLIDNYDGQTMMELSPDFEYTFTSRPISGELAAKNRFTFILADDNDDDIINFEEPLYFYYNTSSLFFENLNEGDLGSKVQVYDIQGRLVLQTTIKETPYTTISKPLPLGTYIVKLSGKRNYTSKFIVVQ